MKSRGFSQEGLKLLACVAMALDHGAAVLVQDYHAYIVLRTIGRVAFPIYCFLLAEGAHYTKRPGRYALRLGIGALLAEIPFDLALLGGPNWDYQSVMVTMFLGFGALHFMGRLENRLAQAVVALPFVLAGDLLRCDYGSLGVLLIVLLGFTRELPGGRWLQFASIALISVLLPSIRIPVFGIRVSIEVFAIAAVIPIALYHGGKQTHSKAVQWAFYLFYPVHLAIFWLMK